MRLKKKGRLKLFSPDVDPLAPECMYALGEEVTAKG